MREPLRHFNSIKVRLEPERLAFLLQENFISIP